MILNHTEHELFPPYREALTALLVLSLFPLFLLLGCATPADKKDPVYEQWKARAETSQPTVPVTPKRYSAKNIGNKQSSKLPESPSQAVSQTNQVDPKELPDTKISITFVDAELGTVLRALGRIADQNIIINPSVKGLVNTHIVDTPWNDVFLGMVRTYGLLLSKEGNLLQIQSIDDLKLQVERESLLMEQRQVAPLVNRIVPIEFAEPNKIAESILLLLGKNKEGKPRGSVSVDIHSHSLIIQDSEDNIETLLAHIDQLDRPTPQILIEAHIIETNRETARELGVQWGWLMVDDVGGGKSMAYHPSGINGTKNDETGQVEYNPGVYGTNRSGISGQGFGIDLPAAAIGSVNPVAAGLLHFNMDGNVLDVQLSALQKAGKVNIISQPSIATLDNIEANIESGVEVPYQTLDKNNNIKVEYKDAVLRLQVTPHVISDLMVRLDLKTTNDRVDFSNRVLGNPTIIKKLAETKLIVRNGTTVVIAGLSKNFKSDGNIGVPYLKDVPILGKLFSQDSRGNKFEEMLLFITPTILNEGGKIASYTPPVPEQEDLTALEPTVTLVPGNVQY
jgi:type IV pilus secretin PilQ/predicted competence protein